MISALGFAAITDFTPVPAAEMSESVAADEIFLSKFSFAPVATTTFLTEVIANWPANKTRIDIIIKNFFKLTIFTREIL
jgi:hypothetical protein